MDNLEPLHPTAFSEWVYLLINDAVAKHPVSECTLIKVGVILWNWRP